MSWHVFPEATHAWDIRSANGHSATTMFGGSHRYEYKDDFARASRTRILEFFGRELRRGN